MRKTARPKEVVRILEKKGFVFFSQVGSHAQYRHSDGRKTSVAMHPKDLPKGTFAAILKQAGISRDDL